MFKCQYCKYCCQSYRLMLRHLQVHRNVTNFKVKCGYPECCASFTNIKSLQRHLRQNHPEFYWSKVGHTTHSSAHEDSDVDGDESVVEEGLEKETQIHVIAELQDQQEVLPGSPHSCNGDKEKIGTILLKLREKHNLTSKATSAIANAMCEVIDASTREMSSKVHSFYSDNEQDIQEPEGLVNILQQESEVSMHCKSLNSQYKLEEFAKQNLQYVPPIEYVLGTNERGKLETMQYVPIGETLKFLLSFSDVLEDVQVDQRASDGLLHDVFDGYHFRNHEILTEPNSLGIIIDLDEFSLTNPLRSQAKHQKLMVTYFQIANLPVSKRSRVDSVHLASLVKSDYVKKHGLRKTSEHLVADLNDLTENGMKVEHKGRVHEFKCALLFCVADNLAAHQIGGFLESFSANRVCRFCCVSKAELQAGEMGEQRNPLSHSQLVENVMKHPVLASVYGIKGPSIFSDVKHFNPVTCLPSDVAHDLFEGVVKDMTSDVIKHCVHQKYTSVVDINNAISEFPYVGADKCDKPNIIQATGDVKETFCKMWCLFRLLPFMVGHLVPEGDRVWGLYLKMRVIVDYVCAKCIRRDQVDELREHIQDFYETRKQVWADRCLKPKDHYLLHYPDQILRFGPLVHAWTIRFESKHQEFIEIWKPSRCSKNISKSVARRHQFGLTVKTGDKEKYFKVASVIHKSKKVKVKDLSAHVRYLVCAEITQSVHGEILLGSGLTLGHTSFVKNTALHTETDHGSEFLEPRHAVCFKDKKYLICQKLRVTGFSDHYHSYLIQRAPELSVIPESKLNHESCLGIYVLPESGQLAFALKYKLQ